jgi:hypothetical protein
MRGARATSGRLNRLAQKEMILRRPQRTFGQGKTLAFQQAQKWGFLGRCALAILAHLANLAADNCPWAACARHVANVAGVRILRARPSGKAR